jgi:hypothetical protein
MYMRFRPYAAALALALVATAAGFLILKNNVAKPSAASTASAPPPQLPLWFERNTGEFPSQVQFASRSLDQTVFLTDREMVIATPGGRPLSIAWRNAKPARRMSGEHPLRARVDRFKGSQKNKWKTGDTNSRFGQVRYEQVYDGVDLVFHPHQGNQLEHDFVVAPGVDPKQISLAFNGATGMKLEADGSLAVRTAPDAAPIRQSKPVAYQQIDGKRVEVPASYRITGEREVEFELGAYDATRELVIDPVLKFATYLGGTKRSVPAKIIADANGIIWMAGTTNSIDFPSVGEPIRDLEISGQDDIYLVKIDPTKEGSDALLYAAFVGGTGSDEARDMTLDVNGAAVIVGTTLSGDFPIVGSYNETIASGRDALILKIDPARSGSDALVYTTFLGGDNDDYANAVATDPLGRIIVAGYTISETFPVTSRAIQSNRQKGYELFISRINPDAGTNGLDYSTLYGGSGTDIPYATAVDADGLIYVAGSTTSDNFPVSDNAYRATYQYAGDMFLIRIDSTQAGIAGINYGTYFGGTGIDSAEAMVLDPQGNVILAGYTTSTDMPIAGSAPQLQNAGGADAFVIKFSIAANNLLFASYFGGRATDIAYGLSLDPAGRIHIAGYTYSDNLPLTNNALQKTYGGSVDAFVASFNPTATPADSLVYASYWGSSGIEYGFTVASDSKCQVTIAGSTTSKRLAVTDTAFQFEPTGFPDTFISTVNICQ